MNLILPAVREGKRACSQIKCFCLLVLCICKVEKRGEKHAVCVYVLELLVFDSTDFLSLFTNNMSRK